MGVSAPIFHFVFDFSKTISFVEFKQTWQKTKAKQRKQGFAFG